MTPLISTDERDELLKNLVIPPRPDVLDKLMVILREKNIRTLKGLPGPVKAPACDHTAA